MSLSVSRFRIRSLVFTVDHNDLCLTCNIAMIIVLSVNMVPIISYEINLDKFNKECISEAQEPFTNIHLNETEQKPDIYYIILDAYARPDILKNYWDYDDTEFSHFLKAKNFYLADKSFSNYDRTLYSLPSSLNMQYLDHLSCRPKEQQNNIVPLSRLVQNNSVISLLKKVGYKYINVSSGGKNCGTDYIPNADRNYRTVFGGDDTMDLLNLTPIYALEDYVHIIRDTMANVRLQPAQCLNEVVSIPGPKFVLIHSCLSHPPFIFDKDGNKRTNVDLNFEVNSDPALYVAQLATSRKQVEQWINIILSRSARKSVIIVQSDHGPWFLMGSIDKYYKERMSIINAYYFPSIKNPGFYPSISPVNSFRLFFNEYFGAKLPLLRDESFCSPEPEHGCLWENVTHIVNHGQ